MYTCYKHVFCDVIPENMKQISSAAPGLTYTEGNAGGTKTSQYP